MPRIVDGRCQACGSPKLVVTHERADNTIDGHCPQCGQVFSGWYILLAPPARECDGNVIETLTEIG